MAYSVAMSWHDGEAKMQRLMHVPDIDNPTSSMLTPQAANMLQRGPLIAVGTLDSQERPWTTIWGGARGLSQPLGGSMIGIKTIVDRKHDPVVNVLFGDNADGEVVKEEGEGRMVGGLTMDIEARKRVKIYGRMVAGAVSAVKFDNEDEQQPAEEEDQQAQVQLVVRVDQSLGNCPKYLNARRISPFPVSSKLISDSADLPQEAVNLILKSDLFFVSSSQSSFDMDTNHRGGPNGFVRVHKNDDGAWEIVWPEYSGNRLYQTLGNLQTTPRAGLAFPDFENGNVLYLTGETAILVGKDASRVLPRSNLAVKLTVTGARFVEKGLPFRGSKGEPSPYNPKVRPLASEASIIVDADKDAAARNTAKVLRREEITPTITRYVLSMSNRESWTAGQWVAFDLSEDMDMGYSHMRDHDPLSINDDFVRTFTVSSPPAPREKRSDDEFEITIRKVGNATTYLYKNAYPGHELPILGFGGEAKIAEETDGKITPIVAGGIGITPLLAQLPDLKVDRLKVFWTMHVDDLKLVTDLLDTYPEAGKCLSIFATGTASKPENVEENDSTIDRIKAECASFETRRIEKSDLSDPALGNTWNVCVSAGLKNTLMGWLAGKDVVSEDFNF